ncbi:hypothetical protein IIY66_02725 [Candidatus Saccharibacteria bacterium]|nr:hypothetical protein [Candidatus Saccharibacteria bacterium]
MKKTSKNTTIKASGATDSSQSRISPLLLFNISMYTLAAICFMVYTTELNYAHADDEDLGSASSSLGASVTVGTACNFSGNVDSQHNATITNGINSTDIGKTTLNVTCNDQGGYAVYAIGYTNDEYGNTSLKSSISDDYNISTGTSTSGNTSNWSMKLSTVPGTTAATIENSYDNYHTVPDDYTKVATLNTITNPGTSTTGSSISTTYQAYISPTQPAGTYNGKVKYTLVHPSTAQKPEVPPPYMQDTATIKQKLVNTGDTMQAIDSRDGKKYWITKLADGNIWMTQNLDLDIEAGRTYTSADTDLANSTIGTTWTPTVSTSTTSSWTSSSTAPSSYNPGDLYWDGTLNTNLDGNLNNATVTDPSATSGGTHYHVGNYYNWTAATAMNDSSSYTTYLQDVNQSICPAGWRLPTYSGDKSYRNLVSAESLSAGTSGNIQNAPTYFVYGGYWNGSSGKVGYSGFYLSSVVRLSDSSFKLFFYVGGNLRPQDFSSRDYGNSLRCVAR